MRSETATTMTSQRITTTSVNFVVPEVSESAAVLFASAATPSGVASQRQARVSRFVHHANARGGFDAPVLNLHDNFKILPTSLRATQCEQAIESTEIGGDR